MIKIKTLNIHYYFIFITALLIGSCASPQKLLEKQKYDKAISKITKKFSRQSQRSVEDVATLEKALKEANYRNLQTIEYLKKQNREEDWIKINSIYNKIKYRQGLIKPLMPIIDDAGRKAELAIMDVDAASQESAEKAAEFNYKQAQDLLTQAQQKNDRFLARDAYNKLVNEVESYVPNYKETATLKQQAKTLGTTHVLLAVTDNAAGKLPANFNQTVLSGIQDDPNDWKQIHQTVSAGYTYHYDFIVNVLNINVSKNETSTNQYTDSKQIQDGTKQEEDENGNTVTVPNMINVTAQVTEIIQRKQATVNGTIEIYDKSNGNVVHTAPVSATHNFENISATFQGDNRALSDASNAKIQTSPVTFPADRELLQETAVFLAPQVNDILQKQLTENIK